MLQLWKFHSISLFWSNLSLIWYNWKIVKPTSFVLHFSTKSKQRLETNISSSRGKHFDMINNLKNDQTSCSISNSWSSVWDSSSSLDILKAKAYINKNIIFISRYQIKIFLFWTWSINRETVFIFISLKYFHPFHFLKFD